MSKAREFFLVMRDTLSCISSISIPRISLYLLIFSHKVNLILEYKVFNLRRCDKLILSIFLTIVKPKRIYQVKVYPTLDFLAELHGEVR